MIRLILSVWLAATSAFVSAQPISVDYPQLLTLRQQEPILNKWLEDRLDTIVPALMEEHGVDMWILVAREYNEDPVLKTMLPADWMGARRRMILVFSRTEKGTDRFAVSRYSVGRFFKSIWNPEKEPDQWKRLREIIEERDPKVIMVNSSPMYGLADGLSHSLYQDMARALGPKVMQKVRGSHLLAVGWLERRTAAEMPHYQQAVQMAHAIIHEGFTGGFIKPGKTTKEDLIWWFRHRIQKAGLTAWFHPSVAIQRAYGKDQSQTDLFMPNDDTVIERGDLLHVDFGLQYMGLNTDTQQHAYVLKTGETAVPAELQKAMKAGNRLQDILTQNFKVGRTGNDILKRSRAQAIKEGIIPSIYTHPIGYHGHAAGTTIGMWDKQEEVPGDGDYPMRASAAWSIELNVTVNLDMWGGKPVKIMLEEDAFFDGEKVTYISGRQTRIYAVK